MSKPSRPASYVRLSTRLLCGRAFPCSSSKYRPRASNKNDGVGLRRGGPKYRPRASNGFIEFLATCFVKAPFRNAVKYGLVRSRVTADDKSQALPHLRQCLVFHIRCSLSRRENAETLASFLVPAELSRSSFIFTPRKTRAEPSFVRGAFAHGVPVESIFGGVDLIQMTASGFEGGGPKYRPRASNKLDRASPSTMLLIRRRNYAPLTQAFTGGAAAA